MTTYIDNGKIPATREPNYDNMLQASELGYDRTPEGCWKSLIDHETLHVLAAGQFFGMESPVMVHESEIERTPYDLRLFEESLVLALQRLLNTCERSRLLNMLAGNVLSDALAVLERFKKLHINYSGQ